MIVQRFEFCLPGIPQHPKELCARPIAMKFTLIFRVPASPGQLPIPLAASMDDEKDVNGVLETFKGQAKKIMRQTSNLSPSPCTIEAGAYSFQYVSSLIRLYSFASVRNTLKIAGSPSACRDSHFWQLCPGRRARIVGH